MSYDDYLLEKAEEYNKGCIPAIIGVHIDPQDGGYVKTSIYNCEECTNDDCDFFHEYNED